MRRAAALLVALAALSLALPPAAAGQTRVIELGIAGGALAPAQRLIRVQQGEEVELRWTADAPLTIHLHGYDLERKVAPGARATTMRFRARATGRFPITLHSHGPGSEHTLGYLEVHPR